MYKKIFSKYNFFSCTFLRLFTLLGLISLFTLPNIVVAAPGTLSDTPLPFVVAPQPNILLMLDDSGSMGYAQAITAEAQLQHGDVNASGTSSSTSDSVAGGELSENYNGAVGGINLWEYCVGFNGIAYDPTQEYLPWKGVSRDVDVGKAPPKYLDGLVQVNTVQGNTVKAYTNPYLYTENTIEVQDFMYVQWNDVDPIGKYDYDSDNRTGECGGDSTSYESAKTANFSYRMIADDVADAVADAATADSEAPAEATIDANRVVRADVFSANPYGILYDSGGPGFDYKNNENLSFTIDLGLPAAVDKDKLTFKLKFLNADGADTIKIYQGTSAAGVLKHTIEGGNTDNTKKKSYSYVYETYVIDGKQAHIVFTSNAVNTREGFKFTWKHSLTDLPNDATEVEEEVQDGMVTLEDCVFPCIKVSALGSTISKDLINFPFNTQKNYANWYSYYRTKTLVARNAVSRVIDDSTARMGFATINEQTGVPIKSMSVKANKDEMFVRLFEDSATARGNVGGGTPLKRALLNTGRYFDAHDNPAATFFGPVAIAELHTSDEFTISHEEVIPAVVDDQETEENESQPEATVTYFSPIFNHNKGGQCQQNFTLLFSDGEYSDVTEAGAKIGHQDQIVGALTAEANKFIKPRDNGWIYADDHEKTLADIAMKYFKTDLVNDDLLEDVLSVPLHGQTITHQHMSTYTVAFGVTGTLRGVPPTLDISGAAVDEWPLPVKNTPTAIDDMRHAAFNGRGKFISAFRSDELIESLDEVVADISDRVESVGVGASFSSFQLSEGVLQFRTIYNTESWWGDLEVFEFDANPYVDDFKEDSSWSVDQRMSARAAVGTDGEARASGRQIVTYNGSEAVAFVFPSDYENPVTTTQPASGGDPVIPATLSANQISDLLTNTPYATIDAEDEKKTEKTALNNTYGNMLVDYLRGSNRYDGRTLEDDSVSGGSTIAAAIAGVNDTSVKLPLFRDRFTHYLGAFVHSQPVYVAGPKESYASAGGEVGGSAGYANFTSENLARRPILYAGANDGMLHGFYVTADGDDGNGGTAEDVIYGGEEVFAYIPGILSDTSKGGRGIHHIAEHGYDNLPYVDGNIDVGDVYVDIANSVGKQWRTYLVGALRGGGKGIYVLDVTEPSILADAQNNANKIVKFEFTHKDLGYVYGRPQITLMENNRWAAVIPNGYNNYPEGDGTSKLFVVYLDGVTSAGDGIDDTVDANDDGIYNQGIADYSVINASSHNWTACPSEGSSCTLSQASYVKYGVGDQYYYEDMPAGTFSCSNDTFGDPSVGLTKACSYSNTDGNGLSSPALVDADNDFKTDAVYAGDLHGNLWVFDLSSSNASEWKIDSAADTVQPLFIAKGCKTALVNDVCEGVEVTQSIMTQPEIVPHPERDEIATEPNMLVFFGSGQYLTAADKATTELQRFYAVWDAGKSHRSKTKTDLLESSYTQTTDSTRAIDTAAETLTYSTAGGSGNHFGWHMLLKDPKERSYIKPSRMGEYIVFATLVPEEQVCSASAGYGYLMIANLLDGSSPGFDIIGVEGGKNSDGQKVDGVIVGLAVTESNDSVKVEMDTSHGETKRFDPKPPPPCSGYDCEDSGHKAAGIKSWSIIK
ncbi:MAG: Tfp pilus tip-associated adhesin PilY1 [Candidatus Endobugula sp.]|jgi:Tfp pilus tip-associated adhesin PilY1